MDSLYVWCEDEDVSRDDMMVFCRSETQEVRESQDARSFMEEFQEVGELACIWHDSVPKH
jgi:hypothetical protein